MDEDILSEVFGDVYEIAPVCPDRVGESYKTFVRGPKLFLGFIE
jgi:hypothetical protein